MEELDVAELGFVPTDDSERLRLIGGRIAAIRKQLSMSGAELGGHVGLDRSQISKIESGKRAIRADELPQFAVALEVSIGQLLGHTQRNDALAMAARLVDGNTDGNLEARSRARQLLELDDLLARVAGLSPAKATPCGTAVRDFAAARFSTPPGSKDEAIAEGRELAAYLREELDLGSEAIQDLAAVMEHHFAVDIAVSPFNDDSDGLCVHQGNRALLLASSKFTHGHVRFTLAHELGHHLFGDPRAVIDESSTTMFANSLVEKRVNAFAANLLMPEKGLRARLDWLGENNPVNTLSARSLVALMCGFDVSLGALVFQLNELGLLTYDAGQELKDVGPGRLISRHPDVAEGSTVNLAARDTRAPERLRRSAINAARSRILGSLTVATLLGYEDDTVWQELLDVPDDRKTEQAASRSAVFTL